MYIQLARNQTGVSPYKAEKLSIDSPLRLYKSQLIYVMEIAVDVTAQRGVFLRRRLVTLA